MPGRFLTDVERDQLSQFPEDIPDEDIIKFFTLSASDRNIIPIHSSVVNRLGVSVQLCLLRYLGFIPSNFGLLPIPVIDFVSSQLEINSALLNEYGTRLKTKRDHLNRVIDYLGFKKYSLEHKDKLLKWLIAKAMEHDKPSLLLLWLIEKLLQDKIVRPGITTLEELVSLARNNVTNEIFKLLSPQLTQGMKEFLDSILIVDDEKQTSILAWLKKKADSNTPDNILLAVEKIEYLENNNIHSVDLKMLNQNKVKFLSQLGKRASIQALSNLKEVRRYPILISYLCQSYIEIVDELIDLFDGCLTKACDGAKRELDNFKKMNAKVLNQKVKLFQILGTAVLDDKIKDISLRTEIYKRIPKEKLQEAIGECESITRPDDDNYFDFLNDRYNYIRRFSPAVIKTISFCSTPSHNHIINGVEQIKSLNDENKRKIPEDAPLDFVSKKWRKYVVDKEGNIDRHYYELSLLLELQKNIKAGNVHVSNSRRYADPETYLTPLHKWKTLEYQVCQEIKLPLDGKIRLEQRIKEAETGFKRVNKMLNQKGSVRIEEDQLIVSPLGTVEKSQSLVGLEKLIDERLPQIELADLLIEVDSWTNYSSCFEHISPTQSRSPDLLKHLYATIMAHGWNLGFTRMAQIASMSSNKLSWTSNWYIREETLKKAIDLLVNYQYHLPLSSFWGDGTFSSSDGQAFTTSGKIRNANYLSRSFGVEKGLFFYSWTADLYAQFGSSVKPPLIRDSTYVLDGLLDNETELNILEHTTDTAGYTYLVFGLFDLLGIKFSPRIKDLKDQSLFCVNDMNYKNLESRIKGKIDTDLILEHWDELKRIAGSLKMGFVPASLYISKLQSYPKKNIIARALQEYGKLNKTIFILNYLGDERFRRRINAQLNKGEAVNGLRQFLSLANERIIRKKQLEEQTNHASCLTLMTNAVITWNTVYISAIIEKLIAEGYEVKKEDIPHISPARYEHVNPYGKLLFDVEKELNRKELRPFRQV